jgi:hypothetical protein
VLVQFSWETENCKSTTTLLYEQIIDSVVVGQVTPHVTVTLIDDTEHNKLEHVLHHLRFITVESWACVPPPVWGIGGVSRCGISTVRTA